MQTDGNKQPDIVRRVYLSNGVRLYGSACFFVFALIYWFIIHSAYMFFSNCFFGFLCGLTWFLHRKLKQFDLQGTGFLIMVYIGLVNVVVHLGVYDSPLMYWGLSVSIAAAFIYSIQGTAIWVALSFAFYPLTLFLKRTWFAHRAIPLDALQTEWLNAASYAGILLFMAYMFYLFQKILKLTSLELEENEERYRNLFTAENDAALFFDQQTMLISDVNPAFCKLYGYTFEESLKLKVVDLSAEPLQTTAAINSHQGYIIGRYHRKKDGTIFPVDISSSFFMQKGNQYAVATIRDVSERKQIEAERENLLQAEQRARAEANQANLSKDIFLATLSHELRNPIAAIQAWTQLLQTGRLDPEKTRHAIEVIGKSAQAQVHLINDLLDISRIVAGKLHLEIKDVNPNVLINESIDSMLTEAQKKSISIRTISDPKLGTIQADPVRFKQIVWNLLANAIKFSPEKSEITVQLSLVDNQKLKMTVKDEGIGIPSSYLKSIFTLFTQVDDSNRQSHGGLGLGLTVVHNLVELHGGSVTASSAGEGKGATFTVLLPLGQDKKFA